MIVALIIIGMVAAGLVIGFVATSAAPIGFQDESGFNYGPAQEEAHEEFASGVSQPHLA
jgi:hypothetical protein